MNGVWRSLLWKEWREQQWKSLLLLTAALPSLAIPYFGQTEGTRILVALSAFSVLAASIFLGAGAAASEQSQRTAAFLQSLPISSKRSAIVKLATALATLWLPLAVYFVANWLWERTPGYPDEVAPFEPFALLAGLALSSLLIWVAAVGVNVSDEIRAGAIGVLVIVGSWAIGAWLPGVEFYRWSLIDRIVAGLLPGGIWFLVDDLETHVRQESLQAMMGGVRFWSVAAGAIFANSALAVAYVWRFGRVGAPRRQAAEPTVKPAEISWLAPPMRRPWTAILWKQMCESLPLALLGAGAVFCVSLIVAATSRQYRHGIFNDDLVATSISIWITVGALVSIVGGIGLWLDDLRPGLHAFWRSRPISPDQWFAVKFAASAVTTLVTLALPPLLIYGIAAMFGGQPMRQLLGTDVWNSPIPLSLLSQFGLFCVSAAFMATIRRPMISTLLTILFAACVAFCMIAAFSLGVPESAVLIAAISGIAITTGWLSVRYDWAIGR